MDNENVAKVAKYFNCKKCHYYTCKKGDYTKHLLTAKHKRVTMDNKKTPQNKQIFVCECSKEYKFSSGLSKHKKKCTFIKNNDNYLTESINKKEVVEENKDNLDLKTMFLKIVNENCELRNMMLEQQKQMTDQNRELRQQVTDLIPKIGNTINNTINNNQKFNINVFLNEKCRDAINMTDFIKSIKISIEELDAIKTTGMAQGLSSAIMTNLKSLSLYERPIHCTDIKRETLYIKDDNHWECDRDQTRIKTAIKKMAGKPYVPLQEWIAQNPDFKEVDEKQDYVANVLSTIGKSTDNIDKKIIKNVCASTLIK